MIIDTHLHPTNLVDEAWRHTGEPFTGERMLKLMDGPYMINGGSLGSNPRWGNLLGAL